MRRWWCWTKQESFVWRVTRFGWDEEDRPLCDGERLGKAIFISKLERTILMEEICWRQISRVLWLQEDDKCNLFHWVAYSNRRIISTDFYLVDGVVVSFNSIVISHNLYTKQFTWRSKLDDFPFATLEKEETLGFERPFEENRVWERVRALEWW